MTITDTRTRWLALFVLCLGDLMIVLDGTIVNVALPSIRDDLGFSRDVARLGRERLPAHVRRLPAARRPARRPLRPPAAVPVGDRALHRSRRSRCGLATLAGAARRGARGAGARRRGRLRGRAVADHDAVHRARASGRRRWASSASSLSGGGAVGVLLGGVLTDLLTWHWIFLVNVPVGVARLRRCARGSLPGGPRPTRRGRVDVAGAVTVTAALMLAVYAIVNGNEAGWTSAQTLGLLAAAAALLVVVPRARVARRGAAGAARHLPAPQRRRSRTSSAC